MEVTEGEAEKLRKGVREERRVDPSGGRRVTASGRAGRAGAAPRVRSKYEAARRLKKGGGRRATRLGRGVTVPAPGRPETSEARSGEARSALSRVGSREFTGVAGRDDSRVRDFR